MPTILVVDDDDSILQLMEVALADLGEVVCAPDAETARDLAEQRPVDLVVLDVGLPGMSGLDLLRHWRADERTAELEVIVLSGHDGPSAQAAGHDAGADAYLTKPVDMAMLESFAAAMLANRQLQSRAALDELHALQVGDLTE